MPKILRKKRGKDKKTKGLRNRTDGIDPPNVVEIKRRLDKTPGRKSDSSSSGGGTFSIHAVTAGNHPHCPTLQSPQIDSSKQGNSFDQQILAPMTHTTPLPSPILQNWWKDSKATSAVESSLKTGITKPHPHDVFSVPRNSFKHPGNQYFRSLVRHLKNEYVVTPGPQKSLFAILIVKHIQALEPPGRFLKMNKDGCWEDIGEKRALMKTEQALRDCKNACCTVTTNVRTSMKLFKSPPTSLADFNSADSLLTSFINSQLKEGPSMAHSAPDDKEFDGGRNPKKDDNLHDNYKDTLDSSNAAG